MSFPPPGDAGWSSTPRGRREVLAAGLFVAVSVVTPLCTTELCPFSQAPMFADTPRLYCDYTARGPRGEPINPLDLGLQRNYWGNPLGVGVGYSPPASVDVFGTVATEEEVRQAVARRLARFPNLPFVTVVQTVVGATREGKVGTLEEHSWRVDNPHFTGGAGQGGGR